MSAIQSSYAAYLSQSVSTTRSTASTSGGQVAFSLAAYASTTYTTSTTSATTSTAAAGEDAATISMDAFRQLRAKTTQDVIELLFPSYRETTATSSDYKTLDEVEQDFQTDFDQLASLIGSMFQTAGLGQDNAISLSLDGMGGITATQNGTHTAESSAASSLFTRNSSTVSQFAVMAARGAIVEAGQSVDGFESAYAEDPAGAIRSYIGDLESLLFGFSMNVGGGNVSYDFNAAS